MHSIENQKNWLPAPSRCALLTLWCGLYIGFLIWTDSAMVSEPNCRIMIMLPRKGKFQHQHPQKEEPNRALLKQVEDIDQCNFLVSEVYEDDDEAVQSHLSELGKEGREKKLRLRECYLSQLVAINAVCCP